MVRVGGMQYACDPTLSIGKRISDMRLNGKLIEPGKQYKVTRWASVTDGESGRPVWDIVADYLRNKKIISVLQPNTPQLSGVTGNAGMV
jgi:sulfur-oxidizing protein SoxB